MNYMKVLLSRVQAFLYVNKEGKLMAREIEKMEEQKISMRDIYVDRIIDSYQIWRQYYFK